MSTDPLVRQSSFNAQEITFNDHIEWYNKTLENKNVLFFLAFEGEKFVGQVRFSRIAKQDTKAEISISITKDFRSKNVGISLLQLALEQLKTEWQNIVCIIAGVKTDNTASNNFFIKAGFTLFENGSNNGVPCNRYKIFV